MPGVMDPFEGAKSDREDQRRQLLDVISTGVSAAEKAYKDAQAQVAQTKQGALDRASQRAQLTGQNFGGADTEPVQQTAGLYNNYLTGQNAASQNLFGQIGASGESYLAKVGAIAPFMQQQNQQQAADRENNYKLAIAQAQAKIDAEKQKEITDFARQKELLGIKNLYDIQNDQRATSASAAKTAAEAPDKVTLQQLIGGAKQYQGQQVNPAVNPKAAGPTLPGQAPARELPDQGLTALARTLGGSIGMTPAKLAELDSPNFQHNLSADLGTNKPGPAAPVPTPFDKNWLTGAFKYEGKPITSKRADEVLKAPEIADARRAIEILSTQKLDANGRITTGDERGMTPWDAFEKYLDGLPGIRTMKTAVKDYYRPYLTSLGATNG